MRKTNCSSLWQNSSLSFREHSYRSSRKMYNFYFIVFCLGLCFGSGWVFLCWMVWCSSEVSAALIESHLPVSWAGCEVCAQVSTLEWRRCRKLVTHARMYVVLPFCSAQFYVASQGCSGFRRSAVLPTLNTFQSKDFLENSIFSWSCKHSSAH